MDLKVWPGSAVGHDWNCGTVVLQLAVIQKIRAHLDDNAISRCSIGKQIYCLVITMVFAGGSGGSLLVGLKQ